MPEISADDARSQRFDAPILAPPQNGEGRSSQRRLGVSYLVLAVASVFTLAFVAGLAAAFSLPSAGFRFFLISLFGTGLMVSFGWLASKRLGLGVDDPRAWLISPNVANGGLAANGGSSFATPDATRRAPPIFGNPIDKFTAYFFRNRTSRAEVAPKMRNREAPSSDGVPQGMQTSDLAGAFAAQEAKTTEALDLYAHSISSRLNLASVSLAREFRDSGEQLNAHMAATAEAAVANIARHGEAASHALLRTVDEIDRRLGEHSRQLAIRLQSAGVGAPCDAVTRRFEESAIAMDEAGHVMNERAASAVVAVEAKLQEAAVVIDHMLERALQRIETKIEGRVDALSAKLRAVDETLDRQWAARRETLASEFATVAESAKTAFASGVKEQIPEWIGLADAATRQSGSALERASNAIVNIESTMSRRLDAFETTLAQRGEAFMERLAAHALALQSALDDAEGKIAQLQSNVEQTAKGAMRRMDEAAAAGYAEAATRLEGTGEQHRTLLSETLEIHRATLARELSTAVSALQSHSIGREKAFVDHMTTTARGLVDGLLAELGSFVDVLGSRGETLRDSVFARHNEWSAVMERGAAQTEQRFGKSLRATTESLEALAARIDSGLEQRGRAIARTLAQATQTLLQTLADGARLTRASIEQDAAEAARNLADARQSLVASVEISAKSGAETLTSGFVGQRHLMETSVAEAVLRLETAHAELVRSIERSATEADSLLANHRAEASRSLQAGSIESARVLEERRESLLASVTDATTTIVETLLQRGDASRKALEEEAAQAARTLAESQSAFSGALSRAAEAFAADFAHQQAALNHAFEGGAERMKRGFVAPLTETLARIEAEGTQLAEAAQALAESVATTSSAHRRGLNGAFVREAETLAATLAANAEAFQRKFESALSNSDDVFLSRGVDVARTLATRIDELRALLERDGSSFLDQLDSRREQLSQQVEAVSQRSLGDFERKTTGLISLLTRRGDDLLSAMSAAASESARKVAQLAGDVDAEAVQAAETLRQFEQRVESLREQADLKGGDSPAGRNVVAYGSQRLPPTYEAPDRDSVDSPLRHAAEAASDYTTHPA